MFCQIATGCSFHSSYDGSCRSFNASSSSPQWRVHFSVMKYVDVLVLFFRGWTTLRYADDIFSFSGIFFRGCTLFGCGLVNDASDKCKYIVASSRLVSFRTEVHYKLSHWTFPVDLFRFGFTWAILMNLRTILILYCEGFKALLKQYAFLYIFSIHYSVAFNL